jgi:predicted nucleotidyltransferase
LTKTEVQTLLKKFVGLMKKTYGRNLVFVIHHGSWATGESNSESDIDTLVMVEKLSTRELVKLREILNKKEFEKFTVLLFSRLDMDNFIPFSRHQFHYGAKVLYGRCPLPEPTREEMLIEIKKIADEVGFWSKYLYTHQKQAENIVRKMYWRFKEAIIALKVYTHWKTGEFPITRKRLKEILNDPKDKEIVEIVENWEKNKDKYEKNPDSLLIKGLDFSQRILKNINKKTSGRKKTLFRG